MKTTAQERRIEKHARTMNPRMSDAEIRGLVQRVVASIAYRSRPNRDPAWEGCR